MSVSVVCNFVIVTPVPTRTSSLNSQLSPAKKLSCFPTHTISLSLSIDIPFPPLYSTGSGKVTFNFDSSPTVELNVRPSPGMIISCFVDRSSVGKVTFNLDSSPTVELNDKPLPGVILSSFPFKIVVKSLPLIFTLFKVTLFKVVCPATTRSPKIKASLSIVIASV